MSRHCDLAERLEHLPPSASVRGLYFRSIETVLTNAGLIERYMALFPERYSSIGWHPMSEFLIRLTVAGALLMSPERVHDGLFAIGRNNAAAFAESLLGKMLLRLLSRDPRKLLAQGLAGRRQSCTLGRWELTFPGERTAVIHMADEYLYLESYLFGAAHGTFDLIGVPVRAQVQLLGPYTGTHTLQWRDFASMS